MLYFHLFIFHFSEHFTDTLPLVKHCLALKLHDLSTSSALPLTLPLVMTIALHLGLGMKQIQEKATQSAPMTVILCPDSVFLL